MQQHMSPQRLLGKGGGPHPTTLDSFTIIKKLGEGTYSTVYHVLRRDDQ
jgi:serine/threonine protein kinase